MKHFLTSIGTPIVELKSGLTLAKVNDLVFDTDKGLLKAIITNFNAVLLFSDVEKWGTKIHIKSDIFLHPFEEVQSVQRILERETSILGNKVLDENGVFLGYCEDFYFHEKTGALISIVTKKSFLEIFFVKRLIISSNEILEITKDYIRVKGTQIKNAVPEV